MLRLGDGPDGGLAIVRDSFASIWRMARPFGGAAEAAGANLRESHHRSGADGRGFLNILECAGIRAVFHRVMAQEAVRDSSAERVERSPLTPWEQYAHALLITNEMAYAN